MSKRDPIYMVMSHNRTVASTLGHVLTFTKDEPLPVPPIMVKECAERGAVRVDGEEVFKEEEEKPKFPVDPGARQQDIRAAMEKIVERNDSKEFTAGGTPTVSAVSEEVGYRVDRTEITKAWQDRADESE